jgi:4'-phosphopantetheinyl transferase
MIVLKSGEIHLWLAYYEDINDEHLLAEYRELLNESERKREPRFYFPKDRRRYLVTRALVRTTLSRYAASAPADWMFSTNAYGRPEIANATIADSQLSFNVSHTHRLIVLAVTNGCTIGVDVENTSSRSVSIDIADRYFAPVEVAALGEIASDQQLDRFFEFWTFKESYIKARGMGLSLPLDKFSFQFPHDGAVRFAIDPELKDDANRWRFRQLRPTSEHLLAICSERNGCQPLRIMVRKVIPLRGEEAFPLMVFRTSE